MDDIHAFMDYNRAVQRLTVFLLMVMSVHLFDATDDDRPVQQAQWNG